MLQTDALVTSLLADRFRKPATECHPARRKAFRMNKHLLVVDNCLSTAEGLQRHFSGIYAEQNECTVEIATDPFQAAERIRSKRFDAVTLDLLMPGMTGIQLMHEIKDCLPPIVINTASLLKKVLGELAVKMHEYQGDNSLALFNDFATRAKACGHDAIPILFHSKFGATPIEDKVDSVMHIARHADRSGADFVDRFDPDLINFDYTSEATHDLCEFARNMAERLCELLVQLDKKSLSVLGSDPKALIDYIRLLQAASFESIYVDGSNTSTRENVHDRILNPAFLLLQTELTGGGSLPTTMGAWLTEWQQEVGYFAELIIDRRKELEAHFDPRLDVEKLVSDLLEANNLCQLNVQYVPASDSGQFVVMDNTDRDTNNLLQTLFSNLPEGAKINAAHYRDAVWKQGKLGLDVERLEQEGFSNCFVIEVAINSDLSIDEIFKDSMQALGRYQRSDQGFYQLSEKGSSKYLCLYLKSDVRSSEVRDRLDQVVPSFVFNDHGPINIYEQVGNESDIVALGGVPGQQSFSDEYTDACIICFKDRRYVAFSDKAHVFIAGKMQRFIKWQLRQGIDLPEDLQQVAVQSTEELHRDPLLFRVKLKYGEWVVEKRENLGETDPAKQVLQDLGISQDSIRDSAAVAIIM